MRQLLNWKLGLALVVLLPLAGVAVWFALPALEAERLRREIAEKVAVLDRDEPGWDLESRLAAINGDDLPDSENAAAALRAAASLFPSSENDAIYREQSAASDSYRFEPNEQMGTGGIGLLTDELLAKSQAGFRELAPVVTRRGVATRIRVPEDDVGSAFSLTNDHIHFVTFYAGLAATRAAEKGDSAAAGRHLLEVAAMPRACGPVFSEMGEFIRAVIMRIAAQHVERVLGLTMLADSDLAKIQADYAELAATNFLLPAAQAQRALSFARWTQLSRSEPSGWADYATLNEHFQAQLKTLEADEAFIAAASRPFAEQLAATRQAARDATFDHEGSQTLAVAKLFIEMRPGTTHMILRGRGNAGMVVAASACERYRIRTSRWPKSLAAIPHDLLREVPIDPFTGKPLAYAPTPEGVILTLQIGEREDGIKRPDEPTTDTFRLYDPAKRNIP